MQQDTKKPKLKLVNDPAEKGVTTRRPSHAQRSRMAEEEKIEKVHIRRTDSDEEETGFLPYPYFR